MSILENGSKIGRTPSLGHHETSVMHSIATQPEFVKDPDLVIEGVNEAFSVYKRVLFYAGVRPIEIIHSVSEIKNGLTSRSRAMEFIQIVNQLQNPNDHRGGASNKQLAGAGVH